jgi:hypothetical protein
LGGGINSKGGYKRNRTLTTKMALARWYQKKIKKRSIPKLTVLTKNLTKNKAKRK